MQKIIRPNLTQLVSDPDFLKQTNATDEEIKIFKEFGKGRLIQDKEDLGAWLFNNPLISKSDVIDLDLLIKSIIDLHLKDIYIVKHYLDGLYFENINLEKDLINTLKTPIMGNKEFLNITTIYAIDGVKRMADVFNRTSNLHSLVGKMTTDIMINDSDQNNIFGCFELVTKETWKDKISDKFEKEETTHTVYVEGNQCSFLSQYFKKGKDVKIIGNIKNKMIGCENKTVTFISSKIDSPTGISVI